MHRKELSYYISSFFTGYLGNEAGLSINTISRTGMHSYYFSNTLRNPISARLAN